MTKKDRFVCWLPCKPYVKQFLLYNFNAPDDTWTEIVNLSPDKELQNDFLSRLAKPGRYENRYRNLARYTANVAVEMPESEVGSTHYRVLFLSALVLLSFTFVMNTLAELIRTRLRKKYASL